MGLVDGVGYVAASLVFATFWMRSMAALRLMAITSNLAFIAYAALAGLAPVLILHALLLPMNVARALQARAAPAPAGPRPARRRVRMSGLAAGDRRRHRAPDPRPARLGAGASRPQAMLAPRRAATSCGP